ncbi:VirB4 family type IV secretion system protein [Halorarius halobius]|uniref:VirB4 family type IV secretion system protein n=1 Tax=Halorarius halobius TaxID=2962671 RepID=UPI0020CDC6EA|nr:transfer complex protein [Halorarius halobius]
MLREYLPFGGGDDDPESDASDEPAGDDADAPIAAEPPDDIVVERMPAGAEDDTLDAVSDIHGSLVAPDRLTEEATYVQHGDARTRTHWVGEFPDIPRDGLFEGLYAGAEASHTDIAIHLEPRDTQGTLSTLENRIEDLQADYDYLTEKQRAGARGVKKDLDDHQDLYDALRNTPATAFDVAMFLSTTASNAGDLDSRAEAAATAARGSPSNLTPVVPRWSQLDAAVAASPMAKNTLHESLDTTTPMLAGAIGSMFPFVAGAFAEPGIEYGSYAVNDSPLILDRFNRETGYCMLTIGKLGAGKSFATQLQLLRRAMYDADTTIVMLDPLQEFATIADALDAEQITVGGTRGLNPLEIRAPTRDALDGATDLDPLAAQQTQAMGFFETFFTDIANSPLGDRSQTLRRALQEAYDEQGITRDPATHDRASPTIRDVMRLLEAMLDAPAEYGYTTDGEQERVRAQAESLLTDLRPSFREDGDLANLARETAFDIESDVVYLDLHQQEGVRGGTETSLMMQVLFNAVYERAKQIDRTVFAIDEAHYLMRDNASLEFLETAVRHSRHYDLSIQFITQTGGEFTLTPETKTIADLCSLKLLHRVDEEADQLAEWFGLSDREANWVRTAKAGEDDQGYSEALLGIDEEGWFPLRIRASPVEQQVIEDGEAGGAEDQ